MNFYLENDMSAFAEAIRDAEAPPLEELLRQYCAQRCERDAAIAAQQTSNKNVVQQQQSFYVNIDPAILQVNGHPINIESLLTPVSVFTLHVNYRLFVHRPPPNSTLNAITSHFRSFRINIDPDTEYTLGGVLYHISYMLSTFTGIMPPYALPKNWIYWSCGYKHFTANSSVPLKQMELTAEWPFVPYYMSPDFEGKLVPCIDISCVLGPPSLETVMEWFLRSGRAEFDTTVTGRLLAEYYEAVEREEKDMAGRKREEEEVERKRKEMEKSRFMRKGTLERIRQNKKMRVMKEKEQEEQDGGWMKVGDIVSMEGLYESRQALGKVEGVGEFRKQLCEKLGPKVKYDEFVQNGDYVVKKNDNIDTNQEDNGNATHTEPNDASINLNEVDNHEAANDMVFLELSRELTAHAD